MGRLEALPRLETASRQFFTVLVLVSRATVLVSRVTVLVLVSRVTVLVSEVLSWSWSCQDQDQDSSNLKIYIRPNKNQTKKKVMPFCMIELVPDPVFLFLETLFEVTEA